jgi:dTDP-4-amino-4,6-dideoxygalactose transaminase
LIRFLDLPAQYRSIKEEIDDAVGAVISEAAFAGGRFVEAFEERFAQYVGAHHCVGVANGTDALEIALWSLNLPPGAEIVVPANSFVATAEAVVNTGLVPVFADCGDDYTIDLSTAERLITKETKAIIPVHLYGQCADMREVTRFAEVYGLAVVEDAAQAHGAEDHGIRAGVSGDVSTFSFYPGKVLGAYGDGGAIVTDDSERVERIRQHINHGRDGKGLHAIRGRNSRLDGIQAAILQVKMNHLDEWIRRRQHQANLYGSLLQGLPIRLPVVRENVRHVFHLFVIRLEVGSRDDLRAYLADRGIQTGIHYARCIPELPPFSTCRGSAVNARKWQDGLLSLPIGEHLTDEDVNHVSEACRAYFQG